MNERLSRRWMLGAVPMIAAAGLARVLSARVDPGPVASPLASPAVTSLATPDAVLRPVSVADSVTIELTDGGFRPDYVQATNGDDLHVRLVNTGSRDHAFQIARLDVDVLLSPGKRAEVTIEDPPLGDFVFASDAEGDEGISGTLVFYI